MEMKMENDETQQAILIELRLIRRGVRGILFVLTCSIVLVVLSAVHPELGIAAAILAGIIAVVAVVGALLGMGTAKVINRIKDE
jgi:uncharacterized membrane protein